MATNEHALDTLDTLKHYCYIPIYDIVSAKIYFYFVTVNFACFLMAVFLVLHPVVYIFLS